MAAHLICNRCRQTADVLSYEDDPKRLAEVGAMLGLSNPMLPYFVLKCGRCGERIQDADAAEADPPAPAPL